MLTRFKELFNPLPGNHFIQITTEVDETSIALNEMTLKVDGEFRLAIYTQEELTLDERLSSAKVQFVKNFNIPFRALPRDNDSVIFKDILSKHSNPKLLLKIAYTTLANTADIIIMEKKGTMNIEATKELLENFEFRAPNYIDILPQYDLVMAKKMHMWGNG
ncbi:hypothetical protein, partial [Sulfurimonas sp.]